MLLKVLLATALFASIATTPAEAETAADVDSAFRGQSKAVLDERFKALHLGPGRRWGWQSNAYGDDCTDNPGHYKLDHLTPSALSVSAGRLTITATPRDDGKWDTGLLTTGDSCDSGGDGTRVRTGDLLLVHVRLPAAGSGAWPGLWTWSDGGKGEMDVFEWHADHPGTLEFANHTHQGASGYYFFYTSPEVGADQWLYIGARFGEKSVAWYVGTSLDTLTCPFADTIGVGPDFSAYPILNLAIDNGDFHPAPTGRQPAILAADSVLLLHPAPPNLPAPAAPTT